MPSLRSFFACGSLNGKIIVAGGHDDSKNALRTAEMYDVENDVWEALPDMIQERDECKAAVISGKLTVISGFSTESQGQFGRSAESLDLINKRWEIIENMWPAARQPSSVVAMKGQLYALLDGKLVRYKPQQQEEEQWEAVVPIPQEIKVAACATALGDGIMVSGFSGGAQQFEAFICRLGSGSNAACWQKVGASHSFCGLVQAACTVEV